MANGLSCTYYLIRSGGLCVWIPCTNLAQQCQYLYQISIGSVWGEVISTIPALSVAKKLCSPNWFVFLHLFLWPIPDLEHSLANL